jgi:hypothetical protein
MLLTDICAIGSVFILSLFNFALCSLLFDQFFNVALCSLLFYHCLMLRCVLLNLSLSNVTRCSVELNSGFSLCCC